MAKKYVDVVLTKDVEHVGMKHQIKRVALGFARNFLIPQGLAELGTPNLVKQVTSKQEDIEKREAKQVEEAIAQREALESENLTIEKNASVDGTLYGSVTVSDVIEMIKKAVDMEIDRKQVFLAENIKRTGQYPVTIKLRQGVKAKLRFDVISGGEISEEANDAPTPKSADKNE